MPYQEIPEEEWKSGKTNGINGLPIKYVDPPNQRAIALAWWRGLSETDKEKYWKQTKIMPNWTLQMVDASTSTISMIHIIISPQN